MSKKGASPTSDAAPIAEPILSRLIVAPVLFVSFLISLVLIDRQTYGTVFGKSGSKDGYYHSHQKKLAKREMDNAFQIRNKVIAAMVLLGAAVLALSAWTFESIWKVWHRGVPTGR